MAGRMAPFHLTTAKEEGRRFSRPRKAGFEFKLHPHMLRHSTGYKLANDGKDTRSIQIISAIRTFGTPFGAPSFRQHDSRISGGRLG
jgi:integrase